VLALSQLNLSGLKVEVDRFPRIEFARANLQFDGWPILPHRESAHGLILKPAIRCNFLLSNQFIKHRVHLSTVQLPFNQRSAGQIYQLLVGCAQSARRAVRAAEGALRRRCRAPGGRAISESERTSDGRSRVEIRLGDVLQVVR
jgi:hypothetical protein